MKIVVSSLQLWSTGEGSCQHQHCRSTMKTETDTSSFVKVSIQTSHFPFDKKSLSYWRDQRLLKKSRALDQKNPFPLFQTFHTHHNWFWFPLVCAKSYLQHNIFSITLKVFFPKLSAMHIVSNGSIFAKKKKITWVLTVITGAENPSWKVDWQHLEKPLVDVKKGVLLEDFVGFKFLMGSFSSDWHLHTPHTSIYGDQKKKFYDPRHVQNIRRPMSSAGGKKVEKSMFGT